MKDQRIDNIQIVRAEGVPDPPPVTGKEMLLILSGGNLTAYIENLKARAVEQKKTAQQSG